MKNKLLPAIVLATLAGVSVNGFADDDEMDEEDSAGKVLVCHKDKRTISVGAAGLEAHLGHGDTEGECDDSSGPSVPGVPDGKAAVVMMSCAGEPLVVTSFSSSIDFTDEQLTAPVGKSCADTLAAVLNKGFMLRSVEGVSEYLLIGRAGE